MTIADVVKILDGKLVAGDGTSPRAVGEVVANDLMSDVLLYDADDILLVTSLASDQAIRTANIVGAMAVVVHDAKPLPQTMCQVADTLGIPLVSTPLSKYESCVRIHAALENEGNG
jgi:predicted transcriptional regulator